MDKGTVFAIILIIIIMIDLIINVRSKTNAIIQLVSLIIATLLLLVYFVVEALNNNYQYPYLLFILLGIFGLFRKYSTFKNQNFI